MLKSTGLVVGIGESPESLEYTREVPYYTNVVVSATGTAVSVTPAASKRSALKPFTVAASTAIGVSPIHPGLAKERGALISLVAEFGTLWRHTLDPEVAPLA